MKLYDNVRIKKNGRTGIIVDITKEGYIIEADEERKSDDEEGYPGRWPLYDCRADEIEVLK